MVSYVSFDGDIHELVPWTGEHIALLTPPDMTLDPAVIAKMVAALDQAWEYYQSITGREPIPLEPTTYNGLSTIAVVDETCGAGCGYLGFTGIEILRPFFETAYKQLEQNNLYDQIPFYELGRNFWFYGDQLGALDAFVTGFAVVNRFQSMEAAGVEGTSFAGADFDAVRHAILHDMAQLYLSDASTTGIEGLTTDPPPNAFNFGTADVAASLFYRIQEDFGSEAYARFWQVMDDLPSATDPQGAIDNFLAAAESATGISYDALFKDGWSLTVGDADNNTLRLRGGLDAKAAFGFDGDDVIQGSGHADYLFGGAGSDTLDGGGKNDVLVGATGDDKILGGKGEDRLAGGPGNDWLDGGPGSDWMSGGEGADTFSVGDKGNRTDVETISDFTTEDRIELDDGVTVTSVTGNAADTVLELSNGGLVQLLDFTDWNSGLLVA